VHATYVSRLLRQSLKHQEVFPFSRRVYSRSYTTMSELFRIIIFVLQRHPGGLKLKLSFPRRIQLRRCSSLDPQILCLLVSCSRELRPPRSLRFLLFYIYFHPPTFSISSFISVLCFTYLAVLYILFNKLTLV
jgi:hypothetical protein